MIVEIDVAVGGRWFAVEDIPEELVANLHIDLGEELGDGTVEARHGNMVVVHLASVGDDRESGRIRRAAQILRAWEMPPTRFVSNWM